jgi:protein-lysine N-methyltransferase EEF2KMT
MTQMSLDKTRRFARQILQLSPELSFPPNAELIRNQDALYRELFADGARQFPPPKHFQLRVLKELVARVEGSIEDWDQYVW